MASTVAIGTTTEAAFVRFTFLPFTRAFVTSLESDEIDVGRGRDLFDGLAATGDSQGALLELLLGAGCEPEAAAHALLPPTPEQVAASFTLVSRLCELSSGLTTSEQEAFHASRPATIVEINMKSPLSVLAEISAFISIPAALASFRLAVERIALTPAKIHLEKELLRLAAARAVHDRLALESQIADEIMPLVPRSLAISRVDISDRAVQADEVRGKPRVPVGLPTGYWGFDSDGSRIGLRLHDGSGRETPFEFQDFRGRIEVTPHSFGAIATVSASSMESGDAALDGYIRSPDVLAVEVYPRIQFHGSAVQLVADDDGLKVFGELTLRGETRRVTLLANVRGVADESGSLYVIIGKGAIEPSNFGIAYSSPSGDEVSGRAIVSISIQLAVTPLELAGGAVA